MTLNDIELLTRGFAEARERLCAAVAELNIEVERARKRHMPLIKRRLADAAADQARLQDAIESAPHLFVRPRTQIIAGIKVGWQKGKGKLIIDDAARTAALIRKHFPDEYDVLVKVTEEIVKSALLQKSAADLKRVGAAVTGTEDQVLIKPTDTAVDKLVAALLTEAVEGGE